MAKLRRGLALSLPGSIRPSLLGGFTKGRERQLRIIVVVVVVVVVVSPLRTAR
jgi:hypothetical protein